MDALLEFLHSVRPVEPNRLTEAQKRYLVESGDFTAESLAETEADVDRGSLQRSVIQSWLTHLVDTSSLDEAAGYLGMADDEVIDLVEQGRLYAETVGDWVRVWTGNNAPGPLTDALASTGLGPARPVYHLVVRVQDEPVACAAAVLHRDALAVEHVVTLPEQRGRGLGTAVTRAVMELGRARGCTTAVLTSSPDGSGIYCRLGFEMQGRVRRYAG